MAANINRVVLVGNLTRDPEMKHPVRYRAVLAADSGEHAPQGESGQMRRA